MFDMDPSAWADAVIKVARELRVAQWTILLWSLIPFMRWGVAPVVDAFAKFRK
jgi:hypothetical protein